MVVVIPGPEHHSCLQEKEKDEESCGTASLTTNLGKVMRQTDPETIPKHTKNKKVLSMDLLRENQT